MNRVILAGLLSHWRRNLLQLITLLAGLALATALWSGVQAVNVEARASYDAAAATLGEGRYDQLLRRDGQPIALATYVKLRRAGWLVSPVVQGQEAGIRIIGIDPLTAPGDLGPVQIGEDADLQAFLSYTGQLFANADSAKALRDLATEIIIVADIAPGTAITDIGVAQRLLGKPGQIDRLIVAPAQPLRQAALAEIAPELSRQVAQGGSDVARLTDSFHLNLTAFGLLSFSVGIFIVNGAIGLAFEQRRPVVRTLRALGVPLRRLILIMAAELAMMALVAGLIGVSLGYILASVLLPDVAATLRGLYGAEVAGTLTLRPIWWLSGLAIALGGTAIAASGAFWQLAQMPLLAGAQPRAQVMAAGRRARWQAVLAVALLLIALVLAFTAQGLVAGFALLASMLIGAALALPMVLDRILAFAQARARDVRSTWFWADTRQQLPGLSLALMALLLALAANVGVSTMVSSFRLTFVGFLDQRLASELYVRADSDEMAEGIVSYVSPRVDTILPIQSVDVTMRGQPVEVFGNRDHATYRDNWTLLSSSPAPWDNVANGTAILINEQFARRADLDIGDTITLGTTPLDIAGIYGDYGNPIGQAVINEALFAQLYPNVRPARFGLRLDDADVPILVRDMARDLQIPETHLVNQAQIKAFSVGIFDRTFTVTQALNVLTLSVAGFAMLMSLLTLAAMRVPQLAPAWAMGMTRRSLGRYELLRAVLLAVLTAIAALPLGLLLSWALLDIVNVAAFGWKLPMFLFPAEYAKLLILALIAAALAALWPAWQLSRTPPSDLLKVFSNER